MQRPPIRQHWVPQAYLRSFCAAPLERKQIHVYDLDVGREFKSAISSIAVKRHFYTLGVNQASPSYAVEFALSQIESDFGPILTSMLGQEEIVPAGPERLAFAKFLATLAIRTRQGLDIIYGHRDELLASRNAETGRPLPPIAETIGSFDSEEMRELFAKSVIAVGERLAPIFNAMDWRLLRAAGGHFITSENPFVCYHTELNQWGFGTPGAQIHVPLSPKLVLLLGDMPIVPGSGTFDLPEQGVGGLNGLTLLNADQYIYSHLPFDRISKLLGDRPPGSKREFGPAGTRKSGGAVEIL